MTNNGTAQQMVHDQGKRAREIIENADYSTYDSFSKGRREVDLFFVDGITAMLDQKRRRSSRFLVLGGTVTGCALIALDLFLRWKGLK